MADEARVLEERATAQRAQVLGIDYVDTSAIQKRLFKGILPIKQMYDIKVVPLVADEHNIHFGITAHTSQQTLESLKRQFTDQKLAFLLISEAGYRDYMKMYDPPPQVHYEDIEFNRDGGGNKEIIEEVSRSLAQVRPDDMLAYLVSQAYRLGASDIHLENLRDQVRVRLRVDGVLHPVAFMDQEKYRHLISVIASAANMSTSENAPQTGHISRAYQMSDKKQVTLNLRIESIRSVYGMDIVMRLFNQRIEFFKLDNLGLSVSEAEKVNDVISHPTGMVLVVGPTGSGKTTTLYSLLNTLNSPERKIITLEDPVEYNLPGVTQIPIQGGLDRQDFAENLRAVLRLDPDVVMIGEIRDPDTARTALQAALTGHLVLSTFHGSNAAAALTRLLDMVGPNPLFASAIHLVMAQRLVRRLDDTTKVGYAPDEALKTYIKKIVDSLPPSVAKPNLANIKLFRPEPSPDNPFGYRGQVAIREQMVMTPGVEKLLKLPASQISTDELEAEAVREGMRTMLQDGVLKAIAGLTSIEEIYRVIE